MKITETWKSRSKPTLSFELFPARNPKAAESLGKAIDVLADLKPDFVSVTFGAGGSTRQGSRQMVAKLHQEKQLEVIAYFAGYGLGPQEVLSVLEDYAGLGIENVLIVRGDPPREDGFQPHPESMPHATDLLAFVRPRFHFCMGVAGYPEGHIQAPSRAKDLEFLKRKIDLGAEYIITNYCYDNRFFFDFVERCRAAGIQVPILPGIMPIYSVKMMESLASTCGATITEPVRRGIAQVAEGDKQGLEAFGIDFAVDQAVELLKAGVPGLHIYTMDRSESARGIVQRLRADQLL